MINPITTTANGAPRSQNGLLLSLSITLTVVMTVSLTVAAVVISQWGTEAIPVLTIIMVLPSTVVIGLMSAITSIVATSNKFAEMHTEIRASAAAVRTEVAESAATVGAQMTGLESKVDGQLSKVYDLTEKLAGAEGRESGASTERDRTAAVSAELATVQQLLATQTATLAALQERLFATPPPSPAAAPLAAPVQVEVIPGEPQPVRVVAAVPVPVEVRVPTDEVDDAEQRRLAAQRDAAKDGGE